MSLIWKTINIEEEEKEKKAKEKEKWVSFFERLKAKLQFARNIKERIERKKLLDEINLLIEEDSKIKDEIATKKLAHIHKTLTKEISDELQWYQLFWKILSADKISWDTFWFKEFTDKYNFFIWDTTWNWLRAWFIITILNRLFNKFAKWNNISELTYEINNWLKQDLKSRNFITWVFFEIFKENVSKIKFVSMWHVPVYIFRKETGKAEKIVAWGLAAGIRLIAHPADIKVKELELEDGDILLTYSDWIVENKNSQWEMYGFERLEKAFTEISKTWKDIDKIYDYIINDIKKFKWSELFDDDATTIIIKRDRKKDIVDSGSDYLEKIKWKEWLNNNEIRKLKWKSIEDIEKELVVLKKQKETDRIVKILEWYYYTWEILRLKQEAIRYIKEWYIDKKINDYLKKAISNEKAYKIKQKNQRAKNKYEILEELLKKWDYDTVINEAEEIISSDWEL
jgi:serine phosphatase RsbU (regulator of sigma subunit)